MKVAAYCPRDRWLLPWLSFNLLDRNEKKKKKICEEALWSDCVPRLTAAHPARDGVQRRETSNPQELVGCTKQIFLSFFLFLFSNLRKRKGKERFLNWDPCLNNHDGFDDVRPLMKIKHWPLRRWVVEFFFTSPNSLKYGITRIV